MDRDDIASEMQRASADLRTLLDDATSSELRQGLKRDQVDQRRAPVSHAFGYLSSGTCLSP